MKLPFLGRKPDKQPEPVRSDERLRTGFEKAPVGIAFISTDGHWLAANEAFRSIIGYAREQLLRISFQYLTHPDDAKREAQMMRALLNGETNSYRITKRIQDRTGKFRMVDALTTIVRGEPAHQEFLIHVIEEASRPGEASRESLEGAIDAVHALAIIRTDDHGIVQGWNRGAVKIFGYSDDEMIGKSRRILYRDADDWEEKPTSQLRQAGDSGRLEMEDWRVAKGGRHLWVQTSITPIRGGGKLEGFVEVVAVADAKSEARHAELERNLQSLRNELEKSERTNDSLREALEQVRLMGEETMKELRIMTGALRKEIERRKTLEEELQATRDQLVAAPPVLPEEETEVIAEAIPPAPEWQALGARSPAELLLEHATAAHTGTLIVAARGQWQKEIFFENGRIFSVASNDPARFLAQRLVDSGRIAEEERAKAIELRQHTQLSIGRLLVILGAITEEQLAGEMRAKAEMEIADLLGWHDVQYVFVQGEIPAQQLVPLRLEVASLLAAPPPVAAPIPPAPALVASSTAKSKKFHRETCRLAARISESTRIRFAGEEEARREGFEACKVCFGKT